jgi:hypothetical protein
MYLRHGKYAAPMGIRYKYLKKSYMWLFFSLLVMDAITGE